ncbi:hypothetical protein ACTHOQ_18545 [Solibacillus silvestris]|uniref:hypothetical protein n=1 Tax=Solibacillus silvestris TaxID=76853 RepID=UPI003F807B5C
MNKFNIGAQFQYTDELQQTIQNAGSEPLNPNNIQSVHTDLFFAEEVHAATFKYPNVISKEQIVQHVEMALLNDEALYCIHWGFVTNEIEELFGNLFVEQLLFTLFEAIYQLIFKHNAEVNVLSKNEGEAFIKNITEAEFFKLLMELEEKLQSTVVHSTSGSVKIPIHFGFIHTDQLPKDQVSYEQLAAFADAGLYYAKSHGQLYIYS